MDDQDSLNIGGHPPRGFDYFVLGVVSCLYQVPFPPTPFVHVRASNFGPDRIERQLHMVSRPICNPDQIRQSIGATCEIPPSMSLDKLGQLLL